MTRAMGQIGLFVSGIVEKAKLRKGMLFAIAIVCVLQAYFVRELLAAELLFALGFAVLLTLGAIAYPSVQSANAGWISPRWEFTSLPIPRAAAIAWSKKSAENHSAIHVQSLLNNRTRKITNKE